MKSTIGRPQLRTEWSPYPIPQKIAARSLGEYYINRTLSIAAMAARRPSSPVRVQQEGAEHNPCRSHTHEDRENQDVMVVHGER